MPVDLSFFMTRLKVERKPKRATANKASLNRADQAACRAYFKADPDQRKAILLDQATKRQKARLLARRKWRKAYQAQYRAMAAMATVII
jgi:hypothetical protein